MSCQVSSRCVAGLLDAGFQRLGVGQHDEGQAVAVVGAVQNLVAAPEQPGVAAGRRVAVGVAQERQPVADGVLVVGVAEAAERHGVVEDEAGAADQVARVRIVDGAVVLEEVEEPAALAVDAARMVERHRVADVRRRGRRGRGNRAAASWRASSAQRKWRELELDLQRPALGQDQRRRARRHRGLAVVDDDGLEPIVVALVDRAPAAPPARSGSARRSSPRSWWPRAARLPAPGCRASAGRPRASSPAPRRRPGRRSGWRRDRRRSSPASSPCRRGRRCGRARARSRPRAASRARAASSRRMSGLNGGSGGCR